MDFAGVILFDEKILGLNLTTSQAKSCPTKLSIFVHFSDREIKDINMV